MAKESACSSTTCVAKGIAQELQEVMLWHGTTTSLCKVHRVRGQSEVVRVPGRHTKDPSHQICPHAMIEDLCAKAPQPF